MNISSVLSKNVKNIRQKRGLTLDQAASACAISRSMLAQIEKGSVNPTISMIWKIAGGLKVPFASLVEQDRSEPEVVRAADITPLEANQGRYLNFPIFGFDEKRLFETYRIVIKPQGSLRSQAHPKGAQEFITVFAGQVRISTETESFELTVGDSLRFCADQAHGYDNIGNGDVQMSMIIFYDKPQ